MTAAIVSALAEHEPVTDSRGEIKSCRCGVLFGIQHPDTSTHRAHLAAVIDTITATDRAVSDESRVALEAEVERWRSGRRRLAWPVVEEVPDGLHYAAELVRAQGTEGGEAHDTLLRRASQRLKALNDIAAVLLAERDALRGECDEAIAQAERHAEDVATAEREVSALRVTVAERDEVRGQLRAATSSLKRVRDVIEDDEMLNRFGHVNFDEDNDAAGARELQGIVAAALDGPDDRSGEAGLCSGSSTGVHLWIGRLAEDGPYRWCEWCKETRSLR